MKSTDRKACYYPRAQFHPPRTLQAAILSMVSTVHLNPCTRLTLTVITVRIPQDDYMSVAYCIPLFRPSFVQPFVVSSPPVVGSLDTMQSCASHRVDGLVDGDRGMCTENVLCAHHLPLLNHGELNRSFCFRERVVGRLEDWPIRMWEVIEISGGI